MTYLFSSNSTISNEVEVKNDVGNALPVVGNVLATVYNGTGLVTQYNPLHVSLGSNTITIIGNTNILDTVNVASTPENPVHSHITEVGTSNVLTVPFMPIGGNVYLTNNFSSVNLINPLPVTATVSGNVVIPPIIGNVVVTGNVVIPPITGNVVIPPVTGNVAVTGNVYLNNNSAVVSISNPFPVTATISGNVTVSGTEVSNVVTYSRSDDNTQLDTGGRLRVATAGQQWWYVPSVDKDGDLRYQELNTGNLASSLFVQNLAAIHLTSGTDSNGYAIRASRRRHKIRPAISHQWYTTVNFDGIQANVTKRVGMFTNFNGLFFEVTDDLYVVLRRRLTDGTLKELRVKRNEFSHDRLSGGPTYNPTGYNWDENKIANLTSHISTTSNAIGNTTVYTVVFGHDGTANTNFTTGDKAVISGVTPVTFNNCPVVTNVNSSNVTLAYVTNPGSFSSLSSAKMTKNGFNKVHTFFFDFNGGKTSHARFCIQGPLGPETLHVFDLENSSGTQYVSAPALMERAEVQNIGNVSFLPSLTIHGSAYNVEAETELNPGFGVAISQNSRNFSKTANEQYAIAGIGLRIGEPYQRADMQVQRVQLTDLGNINTQNAAVFEWRLVLNPTLTGTIPAPTNIGKATRFWDYAGNTITSAGGTDLVGGFSQGTTFLDFQNALNFLNMGSNIDYTDADKVVLVCKLLVGGSSDSLVRASFNFIESL